ncbi:hypothetical protein ACFXA3_25905, partial [Streptomyces sp. NPDC059456]|uniref:hypothetical protein n=1 Tax=Streptomyces sp. NPDC059456 TaxID=3346838 RepID=UPI00368CD1BF
MSVLIVDAANVVGSVPDGWWRDRRGAAERLRDRLARRDPLGGGAAGAAGEIDEIEEIILVVEGAARGVESVPGVRVDPAPGSGDDRIVELAAAHAERGCVVVTADRELRERVRAHGALCLGPPTQPPAGRPGGRTGGGGSH